MIEDAIIRLGNLHREKQKVLEGEDWLDLVEAKKIVPIKSKKKWKSIRDNGDVDFTKAGKGYLYQRKSLLHYMIKNSSIKTNKNYGKR